VTNSKFDIDEGVLKAVAESISEGIGIDFIDTRKQLNTYTTNSSPTLIWDLINSNLKKKLGQDYACLYVSKKKRGIWEFLLIVDKKSKKIITVMRENRLKQLTKHPFKNKKHYAAALALLLNSGLRSRQTKLINMPINPDDNIYLQELSQDLCSEIEQSMLAESLYCILSFKTASGVITSYNANYLTKNLEIAKEIPLNSYIPKKNYDSIVADTQKSEEIQDIPLPLKPAAYVKRQAKEDSETKESLEIKTTEAVSSVEDIANGDR